MTKNKKTESFMENPQLAAALLNPFADGARLQVERLLIAQQMLKHDPVVATQKCYHETSNLFEDLSTVVHYLNLCGVESPQDQLFKDVRDHIRHDVRDEFDNEEKRKNKRAKRLGINPRLQLKMSFDIGIIRIGQVKIELSDITSYLNNADTLVNSLLLGLQPNKDVKEKEE